MRKLTVHMIGNAHLDPVWLWNKSAGIDEAIATCRAACDMLDKYPEFIVTRGEAWVHEQVKRLAPDIFKRIVKHAESGRWAVVNGWWIQPDCNFPAAESFRKHGEIGRKWFKDNLGVNITIGYNVDSFGHAATLPSILRETGFDSYVFMRPGPHEKQIPSNLFHWKAPNGDAVTAFRISEAYTAWNVDGLKRLLDKTIAETGKDAEHTMCFYGVGDHGGGPTRSQIEWILEHADYGDGVRLIFSHPRAFFDAIKKSKVKLPVVQDELQYHAIGCYTVVRNIKKQMREAETLCARAEGLVKKFPKLAPKDASEHLRRAWELVLFDQFHDILAGSSIQAAYDQVRDELGSAKTAARDIIVHISRRRMLTLPPRKNQRVVILNSGSRRYKGYAVKDPYVRRDSKNMSLSGESGAVLPAQPIQGDAAVNWLTTRVVPVDIEPFGQKALELKFDSPNSPVSKVSAMENGLSNASVRVTTDNGGIRSIRLNGKECAGKGGIRLCAFRDLTDTWSHGIDGFRDVEAGTFKSDEPWKVMESGPLRAVIANNFRLDHSSLLWVIQLYAGEPFIRMNLRVCWTGSRQILKFVISPAFKPVKHIGGIPGGSIARPLNGQEFPMRDSASVCGASSTLAVISPDCYGEDAQTDGTLRVTLLRSPAYAHHEPYILPEFHTFPMTDQGEHDFEVSLLAMKKYDAKAVEEEIYRQTHPLVMSETTSGMPPMDLG